MPINFLFDVLAPIYDRIIGEREPEELVQALNLSNDLSLLDVGGGTGRVSAKLKKFVKKLYLVDISSSMLEEARKKGLRQLSHSSSEKLPFKSNSMDRIMVVDALHHFPNQEKVIKELFRVVKPGGLILVEEPDINKLFTKLIAIAEKLALMGSHIHSPKEIKRMMSDFSNKVEIIPDGRLSAWVIAKK